MRCSVIRKGSGPVGSAGPFELVRARMVPPLVEGKYEAREGGGRAEDGRREV